MKKYILILSLTLLAGCSKVEDLQDDPNRATQVSPDLLLTTIEQAAFNNVSTSAALASRQLTFTDGTNAYQYYNWQRAGFDQFDDLKQVQKMVEEARNTDSQVYQILAKFFNAYFTVELTRVFGDIPFTEAVQAETGVYMPAYDTQELIYKSVLDSLRTASLELAQNEESIRGDIIYKGDKRKWQKLINSYSLRVLMSLSNKTGSGSIAIIDRFNEIVNNPNQFPIFESNEDSGKLAYVDIQNNRYPLFNNNNLQTAYYLEQTFVERLQNLEDPRLFSFADKKPNAANAPQDDFNAYGGLYGSASLSDNAAKAVSGEASRIKPRYYNDPINEPSLLMGYAELQFTLAEAAARGWIDADTESHYNLGIEASMNFYGITDTESYLTSESVQLEDASDIASILTQKHIALFLNTGWQSFYDQRRTGIPEFNVDGGGILNNGKIPKRFMYPQSESINNTENLNTAITRQFPEGDTINAVMWLLD
ncbi:SusD/RagB family nutrient-binding outer membrane lipoprotein [Leeuwenhoekiella marinoflava]|uniref:SusD-like starch-binding protein associating with outer membrane n=2 Tax=Leeuwenhoekiella marinoflava TaxID=988 RepID=A0A4Q0PLS0_9FLAO|nr:SusD/RagB family nutrient-binding outer membrane lipoprotein [Leeuwenhoekiella marinoflava]RXG29856.1 SusD-like starch-binding protein associating with outer membrane [Leeuwenhoekiella marinoflava]SHF28173.1 Starch-binding associating with outer membrane [Leeuwenhoekiella marinoflava DSM 3653]